MTTAKSARGTSAEDYSDLTDIVSKLGLEVELERIAQLHKWGPQDHSHDKWFTILGEEVGEIARAILEQDDKNLRDELIQSAAVIFAWIQSMDQNKIKDES
jgi:NTP pyrophosphatase (non-canonical NTP hydrolase)